MYPRDESEKHGGATHWTAVLYLLLGGVIAAFQLGKVSPNLAIIQSEFSMSRVSVGLFFSIFSLLGVVTGAFAGGFLSKFSVRRITNYTFGLMIISGICGAFSQTLSIIFISRILEGVCFVAVVVSYPTFISRVAATKDRALALSIWSVFIPLGFSLALLSSILLSPLGSWRYLWILGSIFAIIYLLGTRFHSLIDKNIPYVTKTIPGHYRAFLLNRNFLMLAFIFTVYAFQWITIMAWFPGFLMQKFELSLHDAAFFTALIVLVNIPGNLFGGRLNNNQIHPSIILRIATLIMFISIVGIFGVNFGPVISVMCAIVFSFFAGMVPATLFATVPLFSSSIAQLGGANGMLFQGSALGQLIGSPIVAAFVTYGNGEWEYALVPLLLLSIIQLLLSSSLRSIDH